MIFGAFRDNCNADAEDPSMNWWAQGRQKFGRLLCEKRNHLGHRSSRKIQTHRGQNHALEGGGRGTSSIQTRCAWRANRVGALPSFG